MYALFKKEISAFLSSVIGYAVIAVFLILTGLFLWLLPGSFNITELGFSSLEPFFYIAPWVFIFLIPAVTMRMFSEELSNGTIELLYTRPITDMQIILAKYLAALVLVIIAILPTLLFFGTIYLLGSPRGNIDTGGTWGSYIGLVLLACGYLSIGIFASCLSKNQIVALLIAMVLCFIMYTGFQSIANFDLLGPADHYVKKIGMQEHYASLSIGLIDTRDVVYFVGLVAIFLLLTKAVLGARKW
jgi:ABC-2 type transport system permease protein